MADEYDVFLSHNSADGTAVEAVAKRLTDEAGLRPFLDSWCLVPGEPWIPSLERAMARSTTVAVFVGPQGMGPWHGQESQLALVLGAEESGKRVIPVLLPGAGKADVGSFMRLRTWVDLAQEKGFAALVAGITGRAPGPGMEHATRPSGTAGSKQDSAGVVTARMDRGHRDGSSAGEATTTPPISRIDNRGAAGVGRRYGTNPRHPPRPHELGAQVRPESMLKLRRNSH